MQFKYLLAFIIIICLPPLARTQPSTASLIQETATKNPAV